jgi:dihydroflavonol-4-reductase
MTLVTGGTGFIGSNLVDRMLSLSLPVRCLVRNRLKLRHLSSAAELAEGDLVTGAGLTGALEGVDTIVHLAGVTKALGVREYDLGNRIATVRLLEACRGTAVRRIVYVSSLAAAGPSPDGKALDESARPDPVSYYGRSKLAAEEAVNASDLRDRCVIVRPPVVYGPRDADVFEVFQLASRGWAVGIGKGESHFSLIHVDDLVNGLLSVAGSREGGGTYYLSNAEPVTWRAFSEAAGRVLGRSVRTLALPSTMTWGVGLLSEWLSAVRRRPAILSRDKVREGRCRYWVCDPSRALRDFGFTAQISMEAGVARTIQWYREAGWLT